MLFHPPTRILLVALLLHVPQAYWAWRLWGYIGGTGYRRLLRVVSMVALAALQLPWLGLLLARPNIAVPLPDELEGAYRILSATWALGSLAALVWLAARWSCRAAWIRYRGQPDSPDPSRRRLLETATTGVAVAPWLIVGYGVSSARVRHQITDTTIPVANLPHAFDGLRIVQLTDIHVSADMPPALIEGYVELASELNADLGVLTGDYLSFDRWGMKDCVSVLSRLQTRLGIVGCLGNHEIHTEATSLITAEFDRRGVDILRDEGRDLVLEGSRLRIVGVDYQRARRAPLWHVRNLLLPATSNLLLSHNPNVFPDAAELGFDLTVSGHTHGGQVNVEILEKDLSAARFVSPYAQGLFRDGTSSLYVSRGIGTTGLPIRLGAPPEIALITLRRA